MREERLALLSGAGCFHKHGTNFCLVVPLSCKQNKACFHLSSQTFHMDTEKLIEELMNEQVTKPLLLQQKMAVSAKNRM